MSSKGGRDKGSRWGEGKEGKKELHGWMLPFVGNFKVVSAFAIKDKESLSAIPRRFGLQTAKAGVSFAEDQRTFSVVRREFRSRSGKISYKTYLNLVPEGQQGMFRIARFVGQTPKKSYSNSWEPLEYCDLV